MKRILAIILSLVVMFTCCCGSAFAATSSNSKASLTLSSYGVTLNPSLSLRKIDVDFDVRATSLASSVGIERIEIYKANGTFVTSTTGSTANGLVRENYVMHKGTFTYTLTSGTSYYAVVTIFAQVGSNYDSRTITTSTVMAP